MKKLKFSLIAIVLIEIALFILVGNFIGVLNTLLVVVLTSVLGIAVAKRQGMYSVQNMQNSMTRGEAPGPAMVDTFMIFLGGVLLVLPGFLTDIIGLTLVFSFTRRLYKPYIYKWLRKKMESGNVFIINR